MKIFFFNLLIIVALASLLFAQPGFDRIPENPDKHGKHRPDKDKPVPDKGLRDLPGLNDMSEEDKSEKKIEMMLKLLSQLKEKFGLTEKQFRALKEILMKNLKKQKELKEEMKLKEKELKDAQKAELKELLGDKYKDFAKILKDKKEAAKNQKPEKDQRKLTLEIIAKKLELTNQQKKSYQEAVEKFRAGLEKLRESAVEKKLKPEEIRPKFEKLQKQLENDLKAFLTDDQLVKLKKIQQRGKPNPENRPERKFENFGMVLMGMLKKLDLSGEQQKTLQALFLSQAKKMQELVKALRNSGLKPDKQRAKILQLQMKYEQELKKVLTADQWDKFKEMRKQALESREKDRKKDKDKKKNPSTMDKLFKELDLTATQKDELKKATNEFRAALLKLSKDNTDPSEITDKIKGLQDELDAKLKKIFNDEQYKKYKKWRNAARKNLGNTKPDKNNAEKKRADKNRPDKE